MKKVALSLTIALFAIVAKAEYLSWCVDTTSGGDRASLYAYNSSGSYSLGNNIHLGTITSLPGYSVADISDYTTGYNFYIEVYNYSTGPTAGTIQGDTFTYDQLTQAGVILDDWTAMTSVASAWNGSKAVATPEPTSGLLMLMGFAMLGLKRKKEV